MKPGDCYIDDYYEPETVVIQIIEYPVVIKVVEYPNSGDGFQGKVVYTSNPDIISKDITVRGHDYDKGLIPVAMITIDNKLMIIKL
jgi:hypothetical protein